MGFGQILEEGFTVLYMIGAVVTSWVDSLELELHCVFSLCNICDSFGEELGVRFPWCFQFVQHL